MLHDATIAAYDQYAQVYDQEIIDFWDNFPKEFLEKFVELSPGRRVLNVGSGSGRDALLLKNLGFDVICQDGSQSMVDITTKLGFESHLAEFSHIDFADASFDAVWAYTSLIHIPKDEAGRVISRLKALLKPGGEFAIGVIEGQDAGMVERKTMPGTERYFKNYTSQELKDLITPLGFASVYEQTYQPHNKVYLNQIYKAA